MGVYKKDPMLRKAEKAVYLAQKMGANETEAFISQGKTTTVGIERGQITKCEEIFDQGIGIRVQIKKAIGFAYTNVVDKQNIIEKTVINAIKAAKASKPDKNWKKFPSPNKVKRVDRIFDSRIAELDNEKLFEIAFRMLDASTKMDKRVFPIEGAVGMACGSNAIANSNGINDFERGTGIECSLATISKESNLITPACYECNAERMFNINPEWVGSEAASLSLSTLKKKKIETNKYKIIFSQFALQELLYYTLINALKADNIQRNQSPLKNQIGKKVGFEELTINDDCLLSGGLRSTKFDGEGTDGKKTLIIDRGVLKNFLYDNYSAQKDGVESTGNAFRPGYLSTPTIEASNFHISPGKIDSEELIGEMDYGLLVFYLQGTHSSNPVNGSFSVVANPLWKIENGKIGHSAYGIMITGNIFELLKNIISIANNERKVGPFVGPWVLVDNMKVIAK